VDVTVLYSGYAPSYLRGLEFEYKPGDQFSWLDYVASERVASYVIILEIGDKLEIIVVPQHLLLNIY
jgi:hypothetical protein